MKKFKLFAKNKKEQPTDGFAGFLLHASDKEKKEKFREAAKRANKDQRILVNDINRIHNKTI
ncbi:MAG: hypothetical protein ABID45_01035 [Patescibacteria group bacterium]